MKAYEVLEKALALIEREENWAQGDLRVGNAFCAEGACVIAAGGALKWEGSVQHYRALVDASEYFDAFDALYRYVPGSIYEFNDSHSHAEVVTLFQKAIRAEKQKAGIAIDLPVEVPA